MVSKKTQNNLFYLVPAIAFLAIVWWLMKDPTSKFTESLPGLDKRGAADSVLEVVDIGKIYEVSSTAYTEMSESWTRFRGSDYDNISKSPVKLKEKFGP
jgi:outer membrane protein assembly factor BamB